MIELVKKLQSTNSSNEKIFYIKEYSNDKVVQEALKFTYDPFFQTNIGEARIEVKAIGKSDFSSMYPSFRDLLLKLNKRELTGNAARDAVTQLLGQCNTDTQDIFIGMLKKDLRCKIGASIINKAITDLIPEFDIQLANKYRDFKDKKIKKGSKLIEFFYGTPKYDGFRGHFQGATIISRAGKAIAGFEKIEDELHDLCSKYKLTFTDGELYSHDIPFQTISSYANRKKKIDPAQKEKINYYIFAVGRDWKDTGEMYDFLSSIPWPYKYLKLVPVTKVPNNPESIHKFTEQCVEMGFEGSMLRHPEVWYSWKRDDYLLKHKFFVEHDFTICGFYEGKGEFEGTLGGVVVEGEYEGKKIKSEVGSGFKYLPEWPDNRDWFWNNQQEIMGEIMEVSFQGISDEPNKDGSGTWALRFATYKKLKQDR